MTNSISISGFNFEVKVNPESKTFLYLQVKKVIRQSILKGKIEKGAKLPSARDLSKTNIISLATAERAYRDLRKDGFVIRKRGDGYFVSDNLKYVKMR